MQGTLVATILPHLRDAEWPGWADAFSIAMPGVRSTAYTPRLGFWVEPGRLLRRVEIGGLLHPADLFRQALGNLEKRKATARVVEMSSGFLGMFKRPIEWIVEDELAAEHLLLDGFMQGALADEESVTFAAPTRGTLRMHADKPGQALRERHMAFIHRSEAEFQRDEAARVSPVTFWRRRGVNGTGVTYSPQDAALHRPSWAPDREAASILSGLLIGTMKLSSAERDWPAAGVSEPGARSYLDYFREGLDGRGMRDPRFEETIWNLVGHLERISRKAPTAPASSVVLPSLRRPDWAGFAQGVASRPLLDAHDASEMPQVALHRVVPEGVSYLAMPLIEHEASRSWPGRREPPFALMEAAATASLRSLPAHWDRQVHPTLGVVLLLIGEHPPERLLDPALMREAHDLLGAPRMLAAIPRRDQLVLLPCTATEAQQAAFVAQARQIASEEGVSEPLTPLVLQVQAGVLIGVARG